MRLFIGMSPNGARVTTFLAEKGVEVPVEMVNVTAGETRTETFLNKNSLGEIPVLELDDGRYLTESLAICRYFESLHPEPALFGKTAEEQAFVEMWTRRIELNLFETIGDVGRHEFAFFADKFHQIPEYAASQRTLFQSKLNWLDNELSDGRSFFAGDRFTVADITGIAALMVAGFAGVEIPNELKNVKRWEAAVRARPSFPKMPS